MKQAVWLITHGSKQEQSIDNLGRIINKVNTDLPIFISELYGANGQTLEDGYKKLMALNVRKIKIIPLFVASVSRHIEEIQEIIYKYMDKSHIVFSSSIDNHPYAINHIIKTANEQSIDPTNEVLLVIGHGSDDTIINKKWRQLLESIVAEVKLNSSYMDVRYATIVPNTIIDELIKIEHSLTGLNTIIVPLVINNGFLTNIKIPNYIKGYKATYNGNTYMSGDWLHKWIESKIKEQ